jgi:hypothetical protein
MMSVQLARLRAADLDAPARRDHLRSNAIASRRSGRRRNKKRVTDGRNTDFFGWVLSLPWVVERPYALAPGVRSFAIDCPPLDIRRLWLVTGLGRAAGNATQVSVIVPREASWTIETVGWGRAVAQMPADHVLMTNDAGDASADVEALVLAGYGHAMA